MTKRRLSQQRLSQKKFESKKVLFKKNVGQKKILSKERKHWSIKFLFQSKYFGNIGKDSNIGHYD